MHHGGDPEVLEGLPWADVEAWLTLVPVFEQRETLGGLPEE